MFGKATRGRKRLQMLSDTSSKPYEAAKTEGGHIDLVARARASGSEREMGQARASKIFP